METLPAQVATVGMCRPSRWRGLTIVLLLIAAVLLVYGKSHAFSLILLDDRDFIDYPGHRPATWESLRAAWSERRLSLYVPVASTAWWGLAHVAFDPKTGLSAGVFHTANVAVHCLCVLLVFAILSTPAKNPWAAGAGAAFFAFHPLQVESVAWASELKDVLAGCLALTGIWLYLWLVRNERSMGRLQVAAGWGLAVCAYEAAALSKPTAALAPLIAGTVHWLMLKEAFSRVMKRTAPLLLLTLPWLFVARMVQPEKSRVHLTWLQHLYVPGDTLYFYLAKLLAPVGLIPDYGRNPEYLSTYGYCWWTWLVPVALCVAVWGFRKRIPWLLAAGAVSVIPLLPVLGFTSFDFQYWSTVADHYVYLAMLGPAIVVAYLAGRITFAGRCVTVVLLTMLAWGAYVQVGWWRDDATLWLRTLAVNPRSAVALRSMGAIFGSMGPEHTSTAKRLLTQAILERPDDPTGILMLAVFELRGDQEPLRQVLPRLDAMIGRLPDEYDRLKVTVTIGYLLLRQGNAQEAVTCYRRALSIDPKSVHAQHGLAEAERCLYASPATKP